MIKGRFSVFALILHIFLIIVSGVIYWQLSPLLMSENSSEELLLLIFAVPLYAVFTIYAVISPLISNIKNICIDDFSILYKYLLFKKSFSSKDIDGYFTMEIPSKDTTYETIYPVSRNRILPPVSSFYLSNYDEVKKAISFKVSGK